MRYLLFAIFLFLTSIVDLPAARADTKKRPELGSILDPEDSTTKKVPATSTIKDPFATIDSDLPSLSQTLRWELLITQKAFGVSPNLRTHSDLITSLQKAVETICFSDLLRSLFYDPHAKNPECEKLSKYLTTVDPKNPLVICLNYGIESTQCVSGYTTQATLDKIPSRALEQYARESGDTKAATYSFDTELEARLEAEKSSASLREMANELSSLKNSAPMTPGEVKESSLKMVQLSKKYIGLACSRYRIVVLPESVALTDKELPQAKPTPKSKRSMTKGSLEDLLKKGPFSESLASETTKTSRNRFRVVNRACIEAIGQVTSFIPNSSAVACYRDGFTSPKCIDARRAENKSSGDSSSNIKSGEGIERF